MADRRLGSTESRWAERVNEVLTVHRAVRKIELVGSRAAGNATPYSDWDFVIETDDFQALAGDIRALVIPLSPLAQQWDRLSQTECYMLIVAGPTKLDFIFSEQRSDEPAWRPNAYNLATIDDHFWDWTLWLRSKVEKGQTETVELELRKIFDHILQPMGSTICPRALPDAIDNYQSARNRLEHVFRIAIRRDLERVVLPVVIGAVPQ